MTFQLRLLFCDESIRFFVIGFCLSKHSNLNKLLFLNLRTDINHLSESSAAAGIRYWKIPLTTRMEKYLLLSSTKGIAHSYLSFKRCWFEKKSLYFTRGSFLVVMLF
ncbi:hypothetical protein A8139_03490 [Marinomonas primoryensis]|uniref:Uncharacterized protein n=1 Tax=Marinomonas primoryensis TaxID=178399 RepID=A0A2Z4PPP6_9GAMM|nr:hypothetical protein A8139_03490 [Marinomonas primoryensis]